jgi:hypothetical protein
MVFEIFFYLGVKKRHKQNFYAKKNSSQLKIGANIIGLISQILLKRNFFILLPSGSKKTFFCIGKISI